MWVSPLNLLYFVFNLHARAQVICSISYWLGPAFKTSLTRTMTPAGRSSSLHGTIHRVRGLTAFRTIFIGVVVAEGLVWFLAPVAFQSCGAAWKCNEGLMFRRGHKRELLLWVGGAALGEWRRRMGEMSCEASAAGILFAYLPMICGFDCKEENLGRQGFSLAYLLKCCHISVWIRCLRFCSKGQVR